MATEIITNINSVLEQKGIRVSANFVQSTFNPAFYQFSFAVPGNLNIGDKIILTYTPTTTLIGYIIDITGFNVTIDSIPYLVFLPSTFTSIIVLPPTAGTENFDVRVVAAFNPVVIEMQRQDFKDNSFQSTWNGTYVAVDGGALIDEFIVGETIQLISESGLAQNFTILNITGTEVTFDKTWSVFNPFFLAIINFPSRINFYVTLRITNNAVVPINRDLRFTPDPSGNIRAEISGALRSLITLNYTDPVSETQIRTEETNLYTPF